MNKQLAHINTELFEQYKKWFDIVQKDDAIIATLALAKSDIDSDYVVSLEQIKVSENDDLRELAFDNDLITEAQYDDDKDIPDTLTGWVVDAPYNVYHFMSYDEALNCFMEMINIYVDWTEIEFDELISDKEGSHDWITENWDINDYTDFDDVISGVENTITVGLMEHEQMSEVFASYLISKNKDLVHGIALDFYGN